MDQAERAFKKAIGQDSAFTEAHLNLAILLESQGRNDDAIEQYETVVELTPGAMEAYCNLSVLLINMGYYKQSAKVSRAGLQREPKNLALRYNLGLAFYNLELLEDAKGIFTSVVNEATAGSVLAENARTVLERLGRKLKSR